VSVNGRRWREREREREKERDDLMLFALAIFFSVRLWPEEPSVNRRRKYNDAWALSVVEK
jgi:hypothetical protein